MGFFDRNNYDRDFGGQGRGSWDMGNRGGSYQGQGGPRMGQGEGGRPAWNQVENGMRNTFDRTHRDSYGQHDMDGYGAGNYNAGSNWRERAESSLRRGMERLQNGGSHGMAGYDRDYGYRGTPGNNYGGGMSYDRDYGYSSGGRPMGGYDSGMQRGYATGGSGYDGPYKSRQQIDNGDPFGDRSSHTPIRMTRGEYPSRGDMEGGMSGSQGRDRGYDRNFGNGIGYDPYYHGEGLQQGGFAAREPYDRNYQDRDRGWF